MILLLFESQIYVLSPLVSLFIFCCCIHLEKSRLSNVEEIFLDFFSLTLQLIWCEWQGNTISRNEYIQVLILLDLI
jgi:hypothetical protein